jgi:hypothetical protein
LRLDAYISAIKRSGQARPDAQVPSPQELSGRAKTKDNKIVMIWEREP